jgi:hypothetical protein
MSKEHFMGLSMSVTLFAATGPEIPCWNPQLHNNEIQGFQLLCSNDLGSHKGKNQDAALTWNHIFTRMT